MIWCQIKWCEIKAMKVCMYVCVCVCICVCIVYVCVYDIYLYLYMCTDLCNLHLREVWCFWHKFKKSKRLNQSLQKPLVANYVRWLLWLPVLSFACFCVLSLWTSCYSRYILVSRSMRRQKINNLQCCNYLRQTRFGPLEKKKWHDRRSSKI